MGGAASIRIAWRGPLLREWRLPPARFSIAWKLAAD
jgi:hypothetical protein